jgi:hypothetical protein
MIQTKLRLDDKTQEVKVFHFVTIKISVKGCRHTSTIIANKLEENKSYSKTVHDH